MPGEGTGLGFSFGARDPNDAQGNQKNWRELEDYLTNLSSLLVPIGAVILIAASTDQPDDLYVRCNGQSLLRAEYRLLFDEIGTTFGAADADHFNVPTIANVATSVKYFIRAR